MLLRTHRERKELYIKALEDEVLRLKEIYSNISHDKERLAEENRQLKALLAQNGMGTHAASGGGPSSLLDESMSNPSIGYTSSGSVSGAAAPSSFTSAFTPPPGGGAQHSGGGAGGQHQHHHHHYHSGQGSGSGAGGAGQQARNPLVDYDQAGIDFVLTYDDPSKAYMSPPHQ
jgi:hypothetical protein